MCDQESTGKSRHARHDRRIRSGASAQRVRKDGQSDPCDLRLGRDVELLVEDVCGTDEVLCGASQKSRPGPIADSINAIPCAACGQDEYITSDHFRCGQCLAGWATYEFLVWVRYLVETRDRLAAKVEERMKPARWASLIAMSCLATSSSSPERRTLAAYNMALGFAGNGSFWPVCPDQEQCHRRTRRQCPRG